MPRTDFNIILEPKDDILGKEIAILPGMSEPRTGPNGVFYVVKVRFPAVGGSEKDIAISAMMRNQLDTFRREFQVPDRTPVFGKIVKPPEKRYYIFEYLDTEPSPADPKQSKIKGD